MIKFRITTNGVEYRIERLMKRPKRLGLFKWSKKMVEEWMPLDEHGNPANEDDDEYGDYGCPKIYKNLELVEEAFKSLTTVRHEWTSVGCSKLVYPSLDEPKI